MTVYTYNWLQHYSCSKFNYFQKARNQWFYANVVTIQTTTDSKVYILVYGAGYMDQGVYCSLTE